ncbi:hypothetical protein ACOME3_005795 [Neoechinorhynchus agilis]
MASKALRRLIPLFDRVLVERFAPETKTKSGILLPEKAQSKVHTATVIAVGPGIRDRDGKMVSVQLKQGDKVLLPEYGGTKVELDDKEVYLFKEHDILAKWEE